MNNLKQQVIPAARKEGLIVQKLEEEVLVYDEQRHKAHCLNRTAALVWQQCDGRSTIAEVARKVSRQINAPVEEDVVWVAIEELGKRELLKERVSSSARSNVSRREVIKRIGVAASVAVPLVTSIVAPKAAQAASCKAAGATCIGSAECCSGLCEMGLCT